jgi:hypothetical protein
MNAISASLMFVGLALMTPHEKSNNMLKAAYFVVFGIWLIEVIRNIVVSFRKNSRNNLD